MKPSIAPVMLATALSGCAVVPYERPYGAYAPGFAPDYPDTIAPMTVVPAPVYPAPVYVWPPVRFSFSLRYWNWHGGHHHHGHGHGFGHHGFGAGGRGHWRR